MARTKTYDSRVYDLAELFLSEEGDLNNAAARHSLAAHIQEEIESEIQWMREHADEYKIKPETS